MSEEEEIRQKRETVQNMVGRWQGEGKMPDGKKIKLKVHITPFSSEQMCTCQMTIDEVEQPKQEFINSAHWFGPWLIFNPYYVVRATPDKMIFGETQSSIVGNYIWQVQLDRAQENY